jgi:hypothetical protein
MKAIAGAWARQANTTHAWEGVNNKFYPNTQIAKDRIQAPANPFMPRLN